MARPSLFALPSALGWTALWLPTSAHRIMVRTMSTPFSDLLQRALVLPESERAALAHELLLSIEESDAASADDEQAWEAMLQSRLDAADRGEFADGDWRDSLARIRESLGKGGNTP